MFPARQDKKNVRNIRKGKGLEFGIGELEAKEPFNHKNRCESWSWNSWTNDCTYVIGVDSKGRNLLTDQPTVKYGGWSEYTCYFTITELEVWKV